MGAILGVFLGAAFRIPTPASTVVFLIVAVVLTLMFWLAGAFGLTGRVAQLFLSCGVGILAAGFFAHAQ